MPRKRKTPPCAIARRLRQLEAMDDFDDQAELLAARLRAHAEERAPALI